MLRTFFILLFGKVLSSAYSLFPEGGQRHPLFVFPESPGQEITKITYRAYAYYIGEHLFIISVFYALYSLAGRFKKYFAILLALEIIEMLDFMLSYNGLWFRLLDIPIEFNSFSYFIYLLTIVWYAGENYKFWN